MAKTMRTMLKEWNNQYFQGMGIPLQPLKDDLGLPCTGWGASFEEGGVQIIAHNSLIEISILRNAYDYSDNSTIYVYNDKSVAEKVLEAIAVNMRTLEMRFNSFAELADCLEQELTAFPAARVTKNEPLSEW